MHSADGFAQFVGLGISILLPLVVIILNGISLRSRRTNGACALSIMSTLLAIILFSLAGLGSQTTHVPLHILEILTIAGGGLMLVSTILAIIGLIQRALRHRHTRGRRRAIVALLLNATFLTFIIINIVEGVNQGMAWRNLLQPTSTPGEVVTNEAWNFRLQPPPEWSQIDSTIFGPDIRAAISRSHPQIYAVVHAEDFPDGAEPSLAGAMDFLKQSLHIEGKLEFLGEEEKESASFLARTMEMRSHERTGTSFHVHWITRDGNTLYRIRTWGADADALLIRQEARRIADGFQLIDRRRSTPKPPVALQDGPLRLPAAQDQNLVAASSECESQVE